MGGVSQTRQAILEYLVREADLDGLVTVSQEEIGAAAGITQSHVADYLAALVADGVMARAGRVKVKNHAIVAYQLSESVMA